MSNDTKLNCIGLLNAIKLITLNINRPKNDFVAQNKSRNTLRQAAHLQAWQGQKF